MSHTRRHLSKKGISLKGGFSDTVCGKTSGKWTTLASEVTCRNCINWISKHKSAGVITDTFRMVAASENKKKVFNINHTLSEIYQDVRGEPETTELHMLIEFIVPLKALKDAEDDFDTAVQCLRSWGTAEIADAKIIETG